MYFSLNLSHCGKSYGHFLSNFGIFKMLSHQIWSCHVTQDATSEFFYFFVILQLTLGKVTKFLVEKLSLSEVFSQKPHKGGGK